MTLDYEALMGRKFKDIRHTYDARDCMLYALGLGIGSDPAEMGHLDYVYEKRLKVMPTIATTLANPGFWQREPDSSVTWESVVHGEQYLKIHRPLQESAVVIGRTRIEAIYDKGRESGAFMFTVRDLIDAQTDELLCEIRSLAICRADGGFGGERPPPSSLPPLPARDPDMRIRARTAPCLAMLYRLNGDFNPLHVEPEVAQAAGYDRPILHGLSTYGIAAYQLIRRLADNDPARLKRFDARFSAVVYPGDELEILAWQEPGAVRFRCDVPARGSTVLDRGIAEFALA
ncbi:MaoC/PaaZ C-terminal domain-containing protein [Pollutimonas bauzanensis]|uniref:MaoC/PaaZ C-terminal domain-containing protein n=1 Tax=Pollutimonas bauzanensis TaxID=658167 RepID=UPI003341A2E6